MSSVPIRHGRPVEIECYELEYPPINNEMYKRVSSTVWVDEGGQFLMPHRYETWYERRGLSWRGPLTSFGVPVRDIEDWGPVPQVTYAGEVVNPDPMESEDTDGDVIMEFDGSEDTFTDGTNGDDEPPFVMGEPPEEEDPEEFPLAEGE